MLPFKETTEALKCIFPALRPTHRTLLSFDAMLHPTELLCTLLRYTAPS
jgi:hypothetical protein